MSQPVTTTATDKVLEQVRHLIAKIEHPNTPEAEREMCRQRADALMFRHAIDEAQISAEEKEAAKSRPMTAVIPVSAYWDQYRDELMILMQALAETNRCVAIAGIDYDSKQRAATVVGFESDVRFVEIMYTSIHLQFVSRIDPKWDPKRSEGENVRFLKECGVRWIDIARMGEFDWPDGGLLMRIYKRQCKADGVEPMATQRHDAYRASFADGFFSRLRSRLYEDRARREEQVKDYEDETGNTGTALVLVDRKEAVNAAVYELFPHLKPLTKEEREEMRVKRMAEQAAEAAAATAAREAMLAKMTPKQRERFLAKEEADRIRAEAKAEREWRTYRRQQARHEARTWDGDGYAAGQSAANAVNLGGGKGVGGSGAAGAIGG